jgi:hypothetical protein
MNLGGKKAIFEHYRKSLTAAGLSTLREDALICPLCWQETPYEELSLEHIVPSSVGGRCKVLTCRTCNNEQGSGLDAHLSQYQKIADAFLGHGSIPTTMTVNDRRMIANLEWGRDTKNFKVVGKASNPIAVDAIREDFKSGKVAEVHLSFAYGYSKNKFQTAVLRAGYLIIYKCFGYEYAKHEIAQVIRRRIVDPTLDKPRLGSFVIALHNFASPFDEPHFIAPGNVNGVEFYLVIIRLCNATTTHLGVYIPVPGDRSDEFFDLMEQCSREHDGETMKLPTKGIFT